jgi:hypothetical protein
MHSAPESFMLHLWSHFAGSFTAQLASHVEAKSRNQLLELEH